MIEDNQDWGESFDDMEADDWEDHYGGPDDDDDVLEDSDTE